MGIVAKMALMTWLSLAAGYDLRRREVPNWLNVPALIAALVWRLWRGADGASWLLAAAMVALCLLGLLPGGDMKGLAAMALLDPHLCGMALLGAALTWLAWRIFRSERRIPAYIGFWVGGLGYALAR